MIRAVFVCIALLLMALLSGCATGQLSEAEQQSLAAAASAPAKLEPGDENRHTIYGEDNSVANTSLIRVGQISPTSSARLRLRRSA